MERDLVAPTMERYLAVAPDTMLDWLLVGCPNPDELNGGQRHCLARALSWSTQHPWELKKAKHRRAQRNAVRPLCFALRPVSQVMGTIGTTARPADITSVLHASTATGVKNGSKRALECFRSLDHGLKSLRIHSSDTDPCPFPMEAV